LAGFVLFLVLTGLLILPIRLLGLLAAMSALAALLTTLLSALVLTWILVCHFTLLCAPRF
jgi:hypothetical protein